MFYNVSKVCLFSTRTNVIYVIYSRGNEKMKTYLMFTCALTCSGAVRAQFRTRSRAQELLEHSSGRDLSAHYNS